MKALAKESHRLESIQTELLHGVLHVRASGDWSLKIKGSETRVPGSATTESTTSLAKQNAALDSALDEAQKAARAEGVSALSFYAENIGTWDSSLLAVFSRLAAIAVERKLPVDMNALPETMAHLLRLSLEVPPRNDSDKKEHYNPALLEIIGSKVLLVPRVTSDILAFLGEATASIGRFLTGKASFSRRDLWDVFRECGVDALPIVSLTSMLLGLILAFVSAIQLRMFGAEIYVAALVGVAMVRVMGPVLTGIVLAGRTGASFAAVIGSMQVNEEVDSLVTFGIKPMDFLVMPRVIGLAIMTPLLAIYADIMGIVGGFLVGALMLDLPPSVYWHNTLSSLSPSYIWIGLLHAFIFGIIVALCGCYQGIRCGRNAEAVGRATTAAVVNSIVGIIVSTSIITVVFTVIDL